MSNLYTSNNQAQDRIYDTFFTDTDNTKLLYLSLSACLHHLGQRRCVLALESFPLLSLLSVGAGVARRTRH